MNGAIGLLTRGALAGAAGTTALNAVSYADMVLRARPASGAPERTVSTLADKAGVEIPGDGSQKQNRLAGLGPLSGIAVGIGVGVVVGAAAAAGARPPWWAQAPLAGLLAMAAADVPLAALGISDPRTWSATDWISDAVPHLAYGLATTAALPAAP
ncbi:MAG: hypothetical protein FWE15_33080 [Actinomycetia bacterium]|nr:hypothetical protein [Actinomycetes bacterium]